MILPELTQWTRNLSTVDDFLETAIEQFLIDRKVQGLAAGTLYFYEKKMQLFTHFCESQAITRIRQIVPSTLRDYLIWLQDTGHNKGGEHACYRTLKAFIRWWISENEPEDYSNPFRKVKAPRVPLEPLEPISDDQVNKMLAVCWNDFHGLRDKAIILCLLDSGCRAQELLSIDLADYDQVTGAILIRQGKGRKPRTVFLGKKSKLAVRAYLKLRIDNYPPMFVSKEGTRLAYYGLRAMIRRRAEDAGIEYPGIHPFRRAFALSCLRSGMDVITLQRLMGHSTLEVLRRYLAQTNGDLAEAHRKFSPVERLKK